MDNHNNICSGCKKESDELLVLSCQHDPCINCVAKQYFSENRMQNDFQLHRNNDYYLCTICYEETKLDDSTINELKRYKKKKIKNAHSPMKMNIHLAENSRKSNSCQKYSYNMYQSKTPRQCSTNSSHHNNPNVPKFQQLRASKVSDILDDSQPQEEYYSFKPTYFTPKSPKQMLAVCKKHEDEEKNFYCFSCFKDICAECAIHGSHFGHEVQAIKKAANRLRKIYGEVLSEAQRYDNQLVLQFKELSGIIEAFKEWNNKQRKNIKSMFNELYQKLALKENSLQKEIDEIEKDGLNMIENNKITFEKMSGCLKGKRRTFMNALNVDPSQWDIETLEYEKQEINQILDEKINLTMSKKQKSGLRYLSSDIVEEAIETISQLVETFQLATVKQ